MQKAGVRGHLPELWWLKPDVISSTAAEVRWTTYSQDWDDGLSPGDDPNTGFGGKNVARRKSKLVCIFRFVQENLSKFSIVLHSGIKKHL